MAVTNREELIELISTAGNDGWVPGHLSETQAKDVLSAIEAAGLVIVPCEPTEAMIAAEDAGKDTADACRRMCAASPFNT